MNEPWNWKKKDLEALIGQAENIQLDFKRSDIFKEDRGKLVRELTIEASAFANSIGGTIVVGIEEEKIGKTRIAKGIDGGISLEEFSPEQLQQTLESNLLPFLSGIRINPVLISEQTKKYALVIWVPAGNTAYQAKDFRYYGRSEYESKPLPDHEIRLRFLKGKLHNAVIELKDLKKNVRKFDSKKLKEHFGDDCKRFEEILKNNSKTEIEVKTYSFNVVLRNVGEININEFKVKFKIENSGLLKDSTFERVYRDGVVKRHIFHVFNSRDPDPDNICVFPQDDFDIYPYGFSIAEHQFLHEFEMKLKWNLYLPNSIPISGTKDIIQELKNYLNE